MTQTFPSRALSDAQVNRLVRTHAQPFTGDKREFDSLLDMIGDSSRNIILKVEALVK